MIIHNVDQGTSEWLDLRAGLPTASAFDKIVTASGELSSRANAYAARLVAEFLLGTPLEKELSHVPVIQWGREMEHEAVHAYEFQFDTITEQVGFVIEDGGRWGCSPDRLVGEDGLLEIKCPEPQTHVLYCTAGFGNAYKVQVQGQMLVTGRKWCDRVSYYPGLPLHRERTERDDAFCASLETALQKFHVLKITMLEKMRGLQHG